MFSQHSWGQGKQGKQSQGTVLSQVSLSTVYCQFIQHALGSAKPLTHLLSSALEQPSEAGEVDVVTAALSVCVCGVKVLELTHQSHGVGDKAFILTPMGQLCLLLSSRRHRSTLVTAKMVTLSYKGGCTAQLCCGHHGSKTLTLDYRMGGS